MFVHIRVNSCIFILSNGSLSVIKNIYFDAHMSTDWTQGSSCSWLLASLDVFPRLFKDLFTFWCDKMFQTHWVLFLDQLWNQPPFQGVLALVSREYYLETKVSMSGYVCIRFSTKITEEGRGSH